MAPSRTKQTDSAGMQSLEADRVVSPRIRILSYWFGTQLTIDAGAVAVPVVAHQGSALLQV